MWNVDISPFSHAFLWLWKAENCICWRELPHHKINILIWSWPTVHVQSYNPEYIRSCSYLVILKSPFHNLLQAWKSYGHAADSWLSPYAMYLAWKTLICTNREQDEFPMLLYFERSHTVFVMVGKVYQRRNKMSGWASCAEACTRVRSPGPGVGVSLASAESIRVSYQDCYFSWSLLSRVC